ncbi:hypothetical protein [Sulfodiicoccus acidiphilus]|uniref:hypothetical protein n=1 Tax=Sulfodiicoccus acidiphilus TaxID=1670455 RepID=UPI0013159E67|nr:hypothetical protein [Sulfodiicoccus acidiphilus]
MTVRGLIDVLRISDASTLLGWRSYRSPKVARPRGGSTYPFLEAELPTVHFSTFTNSVS